MVNQNAITMDIENFALRFKLKFIMQVYGITLDEIKVSMNQRNEHFQIVIDFYIVMKKDGKKWKFVSKKGKKVGGMIPGDFVPDDEDKELEDVDEEFEPILQILTKDPQAGKTHDCIVTRCVLSYNRGRIPIVITPSKIALSEQTGGRIVEGVNELFLQDITNLNDIQKNLIKNDLKCFKDGEIGRWDTGSTGKGKLSGNTKKDIKKIRDGDIKALVVLNNKAGISKLNVLLAYMTDKKFDIIIDEAHSILNIGTLSGRFDFQYDYFNNMINSCPENGDNLVQYGEVPFDQSGRIMYILKQFLERNGGISLIGCTATVSYLTQNKTLKDIGIEFPVIQMNIPECYIGYKKCEKKIYRDNIEDAFIEIVQQEKNGTTLMLHSGHKQTCHYKSCETWVKCCKDTGIEHNKVGAMTDNSEGYSLYDSHMKLVERIKKNGKIDNKVLTEPWQAVEKFKKRFSYLGIFGDICMGESNTYQKCTEEVNCPINHMIMRGIDGVAYKDLTKIIQKSGRLFGNDTSKKNNKRTIWFSSEKEQKKYEHGFKLDKHLQNKGLSLSAIIFKDENKIVKKGNFDLDGKEIETVQRGPNDPDTPDEIESQFKRWHRTRNQTKIARLMRELKVDKLYTKQEFLGIAHSVDFKNKDIITNMSRSLRTQNGYGNIIEVSGDNIRIRPEIKEMYMKYFGN
jgi:hypothetical protein